MGKEDFWNLISKTHSTASGDVEAQGKLIEAALGEMSASEIISFDDHLSACRRDLSRWDMLAVPTLAYGGCDNDSFDNFLCWIVAHGRETFDRSHDSLVVADMVQNVLPSEVPIYESETVLLATGNAFKNVTGRWMTSDDTKFEYPIEVRGEPFDFENISSKYPDLYQKLGKIFETRA